MTEKTPHFNTIIVGSGPAGLGAAFHLAVSGGHSVLIVEKKQVSSGGLRNDCKQNYTYPVGFPTALWDEREATELLIEVAGILKPEYQSRTNIARYVTRAARLGAKLLEIRQAHVGTDKAVDLIHGLIERLRRMDVTVALQTEAIGIDHDNHRLWVNHAPGAYEYNNLILAPGRGGFAWLQNCMSGLGIDYVDNVVDVGIRVETRERNYPIVRDYYDPKILFPNGVRTFCTNSRAAYVVRERYQTYYSVNGHSFSSAHEPNGLVNFAMLKTIGLTDPVAAGQQFGRILGEMAMNLAGGKPMMQRVGDFRLGKRSKRETFNEDLYDFAPTLASATPGDISLAVPGKILRDIWRALKMLDTIVPGVLHPSTILYYPEIKTYANRPAFIDEYFRVKNDLYMIGDGAGTSRGITAAWASGIRAAKGILAERKV
ncbi:MAG: FAD-binding protein [Chitinivibrionales bacterium]|nr:FAD-binding protein [Chitinivibrionales bacterium]MBD3357937.1 FAD-binding protein [Chitinivibrionales bacterium]